MTRQLAKPVEHLSLNPSNRLAEDLYYTYKGGRIVLDPPYQRGDVWTHDQRLDLMYSYLSGYPTGSMILNDRMRAQWGKGFEIAYAVIDGKQRFTTVIKWFDGDLAIPASWVGEQWIRTDVPMLDLGDGPYVTAEELTETGQRKVASRMQLPVVTAQVDSVEAEAEIYRLVNAGGTEHTTAELERAAEIEAGRLGLTDDDLYLIMKASGSFGLRRTAAGFTDSIGLLRASEQERVARLLAAGHLRAEGDVVVASDRAAAAERAVRDQRSK